MLIVVFRLVEVEKFSVRRGSESKILSFSINERSSGIDLRLMEGSTLVGIPGVWVISAAGRGARTVYAGIRGVVSGAEILWERY